MIRALGALIGDALAVFIFTAVGLLQHGLSLETMNVLMTAWPFLVGLLLGHLAIRAWRAPFRLWPQGVFVLAITVAAGMAIRTLFGLGTDVTFVVVTASVLAILLLGWRAIASY
ncbi:MAG: DUF3054 domain-containing protein, partial [Brachybacterium sp.]|nr:DUF3054 domain-containing protein [Brachybacterium sp.]